MARGQAFSIEFALVAALFLATLAFYYLTWDNALNDNVEAWSQLNAESKAFAASEFLVKNYLVVRENEFDSDKVAAFAGSDYDEAKKAMGLSKNYSVSLRYANASLLFLKGVNANGASIKRCGLLNNELVFLTVIASG